MREIEFRAWNGKEMVYDFAVINGKAFIQENPKTSNRIIADIDGKERTFYDDWATYMPKDWALMQYTCLNDKSGVKIFEGDILSTDCDDNSFFYVIFFEGSYCLEYKGNTQGRSPISEKRTHGLVVVGNIYENHELIGGDK